MRFNVKNQIFGAAIFILVGLTFVVLGIIASAERANFAKIAIRTDACYITKIFESENDTSHLVDVKFFANGYEYDGISYGWNSNNEGGANCFDILCP